MDRCPRKGVIEVVHTCKALTVYLHQRCSDITELAKLARQRRLESKVGHSGSRTRYVCGSCCILSFLGCLSPHRELFFPLQLPPTTLQLVAAAAGRLWLAC